MSVGKQKELGQCWVKLSLPFFTPNRFVQFCVFWKKAKSRAKKQNQGQKSKIKSILKKQKRATI
jgi:3-oxoacyl-ACP reductase-like protein